MTGSLTIKNGKYYAVLNVYENGKRKKKWICTDLPEKGNKRRAEQFLRNIIIEYERKAGMVHSDISFADYIRLWMEKIAKDVDEVTYQGYKFTAERHILPYFDASSVLLVKVDHVILQAYIDQKFINGRLDGKGGLSGKSLRQHKNILKQTLDMAVKNKLLPANPCQFVEMPSIEPFRGKFYTDKQLQKLFIALKDDPLLPLLKVTALFGLRRSELLGLQWDCIDLEAKTMTIQHTVVKVINVVAKDKTKNKSSHRTFPLTDETISLFKSLWEMEQQNRHFFGADYISNNYIFKWPDGHLYSPDYVSHRFHDLLEKHKLPQIRFHDLRHSCASVLLSMGWTLKDIQEWLGHDDIQTTANIYSHMDFSRKNEIAGALSAKLA